tara:strand:- start:358 stop:930 length:573 start_codon:yes stop_codon:yes gene_type:complete
MHFLLIPGFLLLPSDYCNIETKIDKLVHNFEVVDIWPQTIDEIQRIGHPKTDTFKVWMKNVIKFVKTKIRDDTIIVAHSAGSMIAHDIAQECGCTFVGIGCIPTSKTQMLILGKDDKLVRDIQFDNKLDFTNPKVHIVKGGHFGCVTLNGMQRCLKMKNRLKSKITYKEEYLDVSQEIANILNRLGCLKI